MVCRRVPLYPYMVLDFVSGQRTLLREEGALSVKRALGLVRQVSLPRFWGSPAHCELAVRMASRMQRSRRSP
ncbi:serine/threonine protein kinase [Melittangium boletus DSM 14713]|uniref:Serine/threonine protein kinase n=1 Tax=Melittangium boletus DSM 14713 TaxID=1294270 RepID=A0A250IG27_9BACT|nr:serine/threonine protein kinase [Melittangium boletus DSM 14713]